MTNYTGITPADVPLETLVRAYDGISFDPERRARQARESYVAGFQAIVNRLQELVKTDEQQEVFDREIEWFRESYKRKYLDWMHAESRCVSSVIVGPSGFPVRQQEKRHDIAHRRQGEFYAFEKKVEAAIARKIRRAAPVPTREQMVQEETMRLMGTVVQFVGHLKNIESGKSHGHKPLFVQNFVGKLKRVCDNGYPEAVEAALEKLKELQAEHLKKPAITKRHSIWDYPANAKPASEPEQQKTGSELHSMWVGDNDTEVTVKLNHDLDRVQIFFPGKPSADVRQLLKKSGWRWSRTESAWQRKLTSNAESSAVYILSQHHARFTGGDEWQKPEGDWIS